MLTRLSNSHMSQSQSPTDFFLILEPPSDQPIDVSEVHKVHKFHRSVDFTDLKLGKARSRLNQSFPPASCSFSFRKLLAYAVSYHTKAINIQRITTSISSRSSTVDPALARETSASRFKPRWSQHGPEPS